MKMVVMIAALLAAGSALGASASEKQAAMHHLASIMAAQNLCHSVEAVPARMAVVSQMYGISLQGDDMDRMTEDAKAQIASMSAMSQSSLCDSAIALYGPMGVAVPNMLRKK